MGIADKRGWRCKGLPEWFGAIFSHVAQGSKGLPGWFGALFFHVCPFDRGRRGGGSKAIWAIPTLLKKGLPVVKMKHKQWSGNHHQDQSQR